MKISAKIDYACRALLELSLNWPNPAPVHLSVIAKRQKIPMNFLVQIFIALRQLGYVESIRGQRGGYVLTKAPKDIKLKDIIQHFGGLESQSVQDKKKKSVDVMNIIWTEINQTVLKATEKLTFEDIANRQRSQLKSITYDI